ncbi:protein of unknown function [Daejeonella rubra]|uniref:Transposase DDE domain-containing protein n=1 Tax=Daejeonella rubra TaxID=990371 RepID=A0A1G9NLN2_9SPHI|nr:IS4 family transposase [Daejeonella rubra]SDL87261.1 protein of unknown function [Daejeonella rubra]
MPKSTFFTGQPVFNQLLCFIPRSKVEQLALKHSADRYCKKFKAFDHLVTMLFSGFHHCTSLRELITGLQAGSSRLSHLGITSTPRRSTLADANKRRSVDFFSDLFHFLRNRYVGFLPDSRIKGKIRDRLFIVDSTTITLFSEVFKACGNAMANGKKKGGVKAHTLIRVKDDVPCFVRLGAASGADKSIMPELKLPSGSILVMDKGYNNYLPMEAWTGQGVSWVTRLNKCSYWALLEENPVSEQQKRQGVISDKRISLGKPQTRVRVQQARIITYYDKQSGKTFEFLTNNQQFSAMTIAGIYKQRWQIELLFKRLKQNFQLTNFLGDNQNAIKIQIWCALIADLLIKIVKDRADKRRKQKWSFANVAGLIRQHLGTYIDLLQFLINPERSLIGYKESQPDYQLTLFKT